MRNLDKILKSSKLSSSEKKSVLNFLKGLTPNRAQIIETLARSTADYEIHEFTQNMTETLDRSICASLVLNLEIPYSDIVNSLSNAYELMEEDTEIIKKIKNECGGNLDMVRKKLGEYEVPVKEKCMELLRNGITNQKKALTILETQFPLLSKAMLTNAFAKVKEGYFDSQKIEEVAFENEEEKQAAEAILEIIDGGEQKQVIKEEVKVVKNKQSSLKVKKLVMVVEGKNGEYVSNEEGITLKNEGAKIAFESVEQLDQWCSEYKEVFALRAATN